MRFANQYVYSFLRYEDTSDDIPVCNKLWGHILKEPRYIQIFVCQDESNERLHV